ncbi:MAG: phosphatidylserine/phosphatidylglycerophosphate/cardiolipin synthase family protein [Candidatus Falkowbacteria bacterium]|nr:phosphatidylserine/phosphatidylglycerophosphate/cardiolipin synthase family protein [Candidatus Falkowbacteria bacterium]
MKLSTKKRGLIFAITALVISLCLVFIFFRFFFVGLHGTNSQDHRTIVIADDFSGKLYFNNDLGDDNLAPILIKAIDDSQKSIELAVYSMDNILIREAIYRAANRGVAVTIMLGNKNKAGHDKIFENLPKNIKRINFSAGGGSMHHKFMIVDRGEKTGRLFFGSYNFTYLQGKYDPCFLLDTTRPEIINIFGEEFSRLLKGERGRDKLNGGISSLMTRLEYPQGFLEVWFTPETHNGLKGRMEELIKSAQRGIKIMIWNFTSKPLAQVLVDISANKEVQIIADDSNYSLADSVFPLMNQQKVSRHLGNLEIITDQKRNLEAAKLSGDANLNSFLHHHLLIVDDQIAVFGTNNWSNNGFFENDESVMISNISSLVQPLSGAWSVNYEKNK